MTDPTKRYEATWDSLKTWTAPDWYQDAKFGIFLHWGVFSVPAFRNEWYARHMYVQGTPEFEHHVKTWGPHNRFGYKDFIPMFTNERYDPAGWASLFAEAGAKYVVPVAEHHDGFAMYDTALSRWSAAKMGPKRDMLGELAEASRERGLVFGVSSHRAEHWWFMNGGREYDSDVNDPRYADFYGPAVPRIHSPGKNEESEWSSLDHRPRPDAAFLEDWLARCCELVDKYRPQVFWFDWWIEQIIFQPYLQRFAAYYYNRGLEWGQGVAINYKNYSFPETAAMWDIERGRLSGMRYPFWQTDTAVDRNSWCYVQDQDYKTPTILIQDLVDIVSKNGCLLLNLGPKPDGTIADPEKEILRAMGAWMKANGEAIYNTRPWRVYGEGPTQEVAGHFSDSKREPYTGEDFRFTTNGSSLYVTALCCPVGEAVVKALAQGQFDSAQVQRVSLLNGDETLQWSQSADGLKIAMPSRCAGEPAVVKIQTAAEL